MSSDGWKEVKLSDIIVFDPAERIAKGEIAKKIGMERLLPFTRKINGYTNAEFKGGSRFRNGDTLLARITPCLENGKTARVDILHHNEIGFGSTEFIVMRSKENISDEKFIYYLTISDYVRNIAIKSMAGTSGRQRVQKKVLLDTNYLCPPLNEQKAIAATLSSLDDMIELNNRTNKVLEKMARAIFKHWFVDFEFPDENGEPYKSSGGEMVESELGEIPRGWKVGVLGDILVLNYGKSLPAKNRNAGKIKVFSSAGVTGCHDIPLVSEPSIIVGRKGTIGTVYYCEEPSFCIDTAYYTTQSDCRYPLLLAYQLLKSLNLNIYNEDSAVPGLNRNTVYAIKIAIPPSHILNWCNDNISSIHNFVLNNNYSNNSLADIRDTLLPKLMSGEIRVPIEEVG